MMIYTQKKIKYCSIIKCKFTNAINMKIRILIICIALIAFPRISYPMDGVWNGIFDINGHGRYDFTGLINNKKSTAYTEQAKVVYNGIINNENNNFIWDLNMFIKDGSFFGTAKITGKLINGNILSGKWITEPAKDWGNIYLIKLDDNVVLDAGTVINKNWVTKNSNIKSSFLIKKNKIVGKDDADCNYYGDIKILNKKIYDVSIEIASCGASDGIYNGMAYIKREKNIDKLIINATNRNFSLFLKLY